MNYLDIMLAIPLLIAIYRGFTKGFIFSLASLVALIGGIFGAIHFSDIPAEYINKWFSPSPRFLPVFSFALTFLLIVGVVYLVGFLIDRIIKATGLGIFNRLAGVIFNGLKMALILSIILNLFNYAGNFTPIIPEKSKSESILFDPVLKIAPLIFPYIKFDKWKKNSDILKPKEKIVFLRDNNQKITSSKSQVLITIFAENVLIA